jgi:hypothetical protein
MLKIHDTKHITWIDDEQTSLNFYVLIADTTADIPSDPYYFSTDMDKYKIAMGSVVWVIADGDLYAFNSSDTWVKQGSSGGGSGFTPTAEQLAAMNSGITAEKLTQDENAISALQQQVGYAISEIEGVL